MLSHARSLHLFPGGTALYSSNPKHWDLLFYIDFEASPLQATNDAMMGSLREFSVWMRELGTYRTCAQDKLEVKGRYHVMISY